MRHDIKVYIADYRDARSGRRLTVQIEAFDERSADVKARHHMRRHYAGHKFRRMGDVQLVSSGQGG